MTYYRRIHEPKDGEEVQFLAVYALRWPHDCGVEPTEAFIEADDPLIAAAPDMLAALKAALPFVTKYSHAHDSAIAWRATEKIIETIDRAEGEK